MRKGNVKILDDVVYVLFCYKQEEYIRESLRSIFNQTAWPGLVLVLDDCSPDKSHDLILQEIDAAPEGLNVEYRHNEKNIGLVSQINSLRGKFSEKLIIVQAGDDIAYPERVEQTYSAWVNNNKPSLIIGGFERISECGEVIESFKSEGVSIKPYSLDNIINRKCIVNGCCAAYSAEILDLFEPYDFGLINEDRINVIRAFLLNGIHYEHKLWLKYRVGGVSDFIKTTYEDKYRNIVVNAERELKDLEMNLVDVNSKPNAQVVSAIEKRVKIAKFMMGIPYNKSKLYTYTLTYLLKTGDFYNTVKIIRRLQ